MSLFTDEENTLIDDCFKFIKPLVQQAGELVKEGYFKAIDTVEVREKIAKWDMVTEYDNRVEQFLVTAIKEKYADHKYVKAHFYLLFHLNLLFPFYRFIAEESEDTNQALTAEPTWIIDPIDGTNNFVRRIPLIAISVAFVLKKEICMGIIYNPIIGDSYEARLGNGSFLNGKRISCTSVEKLEDATIGHEISFLRVPKYQERNKKQVLAFGASCQG